MGYYINPSEETKEDWVKKNAKFFDGGWDEVPEGSTLLVWMDNGPFTALAIIYSEKELQAFFRGDDNRPKRKLLAPTDKVIEVYGDPTLKEVLTRA